LEVKAERTRVEQNRRLCDEQREALAQAEKDVAERLMKAREEAEQYEEKR
jgi:hypothetical protein